jgi:bromodomain-containing factor 1
MAAMATDTPLNPLSFPDKAQPLADTSALSEKPVNGYASTTSTTREDSGLTSVSDATHYDALFDDSTANKNGMTNGTSTTQEDASALPQKVVAAEDASAAPVEHVEGGISGVAAFLPASTNDDAIPPATEPPATMTEPAPVEPTTSDARDEPLLPADPAKAVVEAEGPLPGEPSPTPVEEPAPQGDATSPPADKMDTTEDAPVASSPGNAEAEALLDKPDVPMESVEPQVTPAVSSVVTTIPAPAEDAKPIAQPEQATTGQVRQREEDDEAEPAPKRAKTESGDDEAATSAPVTSAPSANAETAPAAAADTSAPATSAVPAPVQTPRASLQEIPSIDANPITLAQEKFLLEQIRKAKKTKSAVAFLLPVDWAHMNIPTYPDVVKHPMDLKTMEEKLKAHEYETADAMMKDFQQMVQNSILFNGEQHPIAQAGQSLRAYFIKCVSLLPKGEAAKAVDQKPKKVEPAPPKVARPARQATIPVAKSPATEKPAGFLNEHGMPIIRRDSSAQNDRPKREIHPPKRDLPASASRPKKKKHQLELKFCEQVVAELHKKKYYAFSYAFLNPVDPVALNIPNYLRIIKKPMDFGTIQTNLKSGHYQYAKECYTDCKLVFANCYKFNPPSDGVYEMGQKLEAVFDTEWAKKDTWIANNLPPSEPASEDEEEVEEEPEEEEDPNMRRMQEIQAQIAALSAEAMQLTTGPRKASPKAPVKTKVAKTGTTKPKAAKQAAAASAPAPKAAKQKKAPKAKRLTLDQKREVSDGIANLDEAKMRKAVQIIRNGVPHLAVSSPPHPPFKFTPLTPPPPERPRRRARARHRRDPRRRALKAVGLREDVRPEARARGYAGLHGRGRRRLHTARRGRGCGRWAATQE